jgi:hypothetical protein
MYLLSKYIIGSFGLQGRDVFGDVKKEILARIPWPECDPVYWENLRMAR